MTLCNYYCNFFNMKKELVQFQLDNQNLTKLSPNYPWSVLRIIGIGWSDIELFYSLGNKKNKIIKQIRR